MAMAILGQRRHFHWWPILYRHWVSTAKTCREMKVIIDSTLDRMEEVIAEVSGQLPRSCPGDVASSIFNGMREARDQLTRSKQS